MNTDKKRFLYHLKIKGISDKNHKKFLKDSKDHRYEGMGCWLLEYNKVMVFIWIATVKKWLQGKMY